VGDDAGNWLVASNRAHGIAAPSPSGRHVYPEQPFRRPRIRAQRRLPEQTRPLASNGELAARTETI
jgi:hypothetical protein